MNNGLEQSATQNNETNAGKRSRSSNYYKEPENDLKMHNPGTHFYALCKKRWFFNIQIRYDNSSKFLYTIVDASWFSGFISKKRRKMERWLFNNASISNYQIRTVNNGYSILLSTPNGVAADSLNVSHEEVSKVDQEFM